MCAVAPRRHAPISFSCLHFVLIFLYSQLDEARKQQEMRKAENDALMLRMQQQQQQQQLQECGLADGTFSTKIFTKQTLRCVYA